jgi:hypothetical protein
MRALTEWGFSHEYGGGWKFRAYLAWLIASDSL